LLHEIPTFRQIKIACCVGLACVAALIAAPASRAQSCQAPPGTSGIEQYCESIPGAGGERGPGDRSPSGKSVPAGTKRFLERRSAGEQILRLAGSGGGRGRNRAPSDGRRGAGPAVPERAAPAPSASPLTAIAHALGPDSGADPAFYWLLVALALLLGGLGWMGRQGSREAR
jgi:hypothetical protein